MKEKFIRLSQKISHFQIRFLLFLLYVVVIAPMGLLWRLLRKDPLNRKIDNKKASYYIKYKEGELDLSNFSKPF